MTFAVRFTPEAAADLERLYDFIFERVATDFKLVENALQAIS
jgi:plasmid stabilization system protein ParE